MDRLLQAILRESLPFFIRKAFATVSLGEAFLPNWHIAAIAHQLMRVHAGQTQRLLINQPPRSLKSICVSVAYVAWLVRGAKVLARGDLGCNFFAGGILESAFL